MNPDKIDVAIDALRDALDEAKPNDRSEKDRLVAILLTDLQKLEACCHAWGIKAGA